MFSIMNISGYAIPAYYLLALLPHFYAVEIIKKANNSRWDSSNPRSSNWDDTLRKSVPAATYAQYERAKAAHKNSMENMGLFMCAVILGNVAKLPTSTLNGMVGLYLALRLGYTLAYINTTSKRWSFIRSIFFASSTLLVMTLIVKGANVLAMDS